MCHEIRTPLNGIIGLTDLTLQTALDSTQKDYLEKVKLSSHSLLNIINDILDYSKIEAGKLEIVNERFNLNELIRDVCNLFEYRIKQKGLKLDITVDKEIDSTLVGDSLRITQVLNNFIGNSIKFTEEGFIHLDVLLLEKRYEYLKLIFSVKDSGVGIAKENQDKIFKAFNP